MICLIQREHISLDGNEWKKMDIYRRYFMFLAIKALRRSIVHFWEKSICQSMYFLNFFLSILCLNPGVPRAPSHLPLRLVCLLNCSLLEIEKAIVLMRSPWVHFVFRLALGASLKTKHTMICFGSCS